MLDHTETFGSLHQLLSELGAKNLLKVLDNVNLNKEILQDDRLSKLCSQNQKMIQN